MKPSQKKKRTKDAPDYADALVAWISEGKTLRDFCRQEGMPAFQRVYERIATDADLAGRIARARDIGADAIAEDILSIVDDARNDWMERLDKEGQPIGWMLNGDHVQRSKLRAEMRLKLLAKWNPKKYGDKLGLDVSGNLDIGDRLLRAKERMMADE